MTSTGGVSRSRTGEIPPSLPGDKVEAQKGKLETLEVKISSI